MAKSTLLEIVQEILSDMDSDNVNSINDTDEAMQVATIVQSTYDAMISNRNWPHTKRTIQLVASGDNLLPTHMTFNENVKEMISIYYDRHTLVDTRLQFKPVGWLEPDDFLRYTNKRDSTDSNTFIVNDPTGVRLLIRSNTSPLYYTSFDDTTIVFDSWDSAVDSTLQTNKTQARAYIIPTFIMSDEFIPDLPLEAFPALIEEAKSKAQLKLKQMQDIKAEQESGRQQRWLSRKAWRVNGGIRYPDYGRKRRGWNRDVTFSREDN